MGSWGVTHEVPSLILKDYRKVLCTVQSTIARSLRKSSGKSLCEYISKLWKLISYESVYKNGIILLYS